MVARFIWPLPRIISRDFYYKSTIYIGGQHMAIDIPASSGTPIKVAAAGQVRGVGWDIYSGFFVAVDHANNWTTRYRHLYGQSPVKAGQQVSQGQVIGTVGSTGWSTGPHLHLDLWNTNPQSPEAIYKQDWWAHDPELYLGQEENDMDEETVQRMIDDAFMKQNTSEWRLQQIANLMPDMNEHLRNIVRDIIKDTAGPGRLRRGDQVTLM